MKYWGFQSLGYFSGFQDWEILNRGFWDWCCEDQRCSATSVSLGLSILMWIEVPKLSRGVECRCASVFPAWLACPFLQILNFFKFWNSMFWWIVWHSKCTFCFIVIKKMQPRNPGLKAHLTQVLVALKTFTFRKMQLLFSSK